MRIIDFLWQVTGVILQAGGVLIFLWGVALFFRHPHSAPAPAVSGIPVNDSVSKVTWLIVGLGVFALGYSLRKMYHHTKGQIDSRFIKDSKKNAG